MAEMPTTQPAAYHHSAGSNEPVTRIVLHDEEFPVSVHSAEDVAHYFSRSSAGGSAHYTVDADSVQHPLAESVIAWHAPPNAGSIGVEHDGYARFSRAEWDAPASHATLLRSAKLVAEICHRRGIPARYLRADDLKTNPKVTGITTHADVTRAFGQSDHLDPGSQFPIDEYIAMVRSELAKLSATAPVRRPVVVHHDAPRPTPSWYHRVLRVAKPLTHGADVEHVQRRLAQHDDGWYGPRTADAVRAVQRRHHIADDGVVGPDTARAIG